MDGSSAVGESVRESLEGLLKSVGLVEAFALAGDFLNSKALSDSRRAYAVHEQPRTSEEIDREPAVDPRHFRYGAWRRGGPGRSPGRTVDCLLKRFNETFGADGAAELLAVKIGLRRQEKPGSPNGTGSEPSDGNPFAEM